MALGALYSIGSGIVNAIKGNKERKKADAALFNLMRARPDYQIPEEARTAVTLSQNATNAGNPAIDSAYRQSQIAAANTIAAAQRNAGSGSEAIQAAANAQAMQMNQLPQLAQLQTQTDMSNRGALYNALGNMQQQKQILAQDQLDKNQMWQNYRAGQLGAATARKAAGNAGIQNGLNSIDAEARQIASLLLGGGLKGG